MTIKKDLIRLLNKYSEDPQASKVLMGALSSLDGTPVNVNHPVPEAKEPAIPPGVHILKDKIIIVPTPVVNYPKGLIIECSGKRAEGDIKAGVSEYDLPPIILEGETARAYIKPIKQPLMVGQNDTGYAKQIVSEVELPKTPSTGTYPGL